jgi:prolipoprotein diacylglyceryltransferase
MVGNMGQWLSVPFVIAGLIILGKQYFFQSQQIQKKEV